MARGKLAAVPKGRTMPSRRREQWMLITASLVVLAAIAIAFILWFTRGVMIPFVLAVFVVAVVAPLADFMETRLRFRRWMSVAFVLLLVLVVTAGFLLFLLAARDPQRWQVPEYAATETSIRRYLATNTAISAATGILVGVILTALGLELAIVFAVFAFLLNFIPSIGSIIATLIPLPIAYAQFVATAAEPSWWMVLAVLAIPGAVQMVIGNVLEPRIMGEGVGLHPIVVLFALAFWGLLWGPVGAILAVPITAVVRIAISRFESLQLITDLMAGTLPGQRKNDSTEVSMA